MDNINETKRVNLCPVCGACPEVLIEKNEGHVTIGEEGNKVRLNRESWNELVRLIYSGELEKF